MLPVPQRFQEPLILEVVNGGFSGPCFKSKCPPQLWQPPQQESVPVSQVAVQTTAKPTAMYQNNDIPRIAGQERVVPAPQTEVDTLESSLDDEVLQTEEQRTVEQVEPAGNPSAELASGQQHPDKQVIDVSWWKISW